jgi:DtxR family transcriptional regulator, Mn-dependent transcriptional regulator
MMKPSVENKKSTDRKSRGSPARRLSANMEDYLEAIYRLSDKSGYSRVSTIAEAIGVKKPSVSKALKRLQREGLVAHTPYGGATVTARGKQVAEAQVRSHRALTRFLEHVLLLSEELAEHDACLMEHAISHETVERLVSFIDYLDRHGGSVITAFRASLKLDSMRPNSARPKPKRSSRATAQVAERKWTSKV